MSKQTPAPRSDGSPYIPVITYTMACPTVITIPNTETVETLMSKTTQCKPNNHH